VRQSQQLPGVAQSTASGAWPNMGQLLAIKMMQGAGHGAGSTGGQGSEAAGAAGGAGGGATDLMPLTAGLKKRLQGRPPGAAQ
jgi:hypothetical protein